MILVLTGPAGAGKTSVQKGILAQQDAGKIPRRFGKVVTTTTRPPRPDEEDGDHYHFWVNNFGFFMERVKAGDFIEYEHHQANQHLYGMRFLSLSAVAELGLVPLIALETKGAENLKRNGRRLLGDDVIVISIDVPEPKHENMLKRLRDRGDHEADIVQRMLFADMERKRITEGGFCDHHVVNDTLEHAIGEVLRISNVCPVLM